MSKQEFEREQQARVAAEQRAARAERASKVHDAIEAAGFSGERAKLLARLVDPASTDLPAAVSGVVAQYPKMLAEQPAPPARRPGPPPAETTGRKMPEGYVSPAEYASTPMQVRYSEKFQQRVAVSRPFWAKTFRARDLPAAD